MPSAEIVAIGTELLLGETVDTNTRFIARALRNLGIDLFRAQTVGDNAGRIAMAVCQALKRADILITTGGLGPTVDDPTRQAIADASGLPLVFHPELWDQIVKRISRYGRSPTENQKRQAYIPEGAIVIENPVGTAPAFIVELLADQKPGHKVLISLPGVPREMETLLTEKVLPYLQVHFDLHEVLVIRTLHVSGLGEGLIDDRIGDLELLANPTVGLAAHSGVVDIRIAAKAGTLQAAGQMIAGVESDLRERLGDNIFGADDETMETSLFSALAARGWTLACLECNLEGALIKRFASSVHPVYLGGSTLSCLAGDLGKETLAFRSQAGASVGLGVAYTLTQETQQVSIWIVTPQDQVERSLSYGGHPANARRWAVNNALDLLRRHLLERG